MATHEETRVTDVTFAPDAKERATVTAKAMDGATRTFRPRYVLDASGRDTFLANRTTEKTVNKHNNTAAVRPLRRRGAAGRRHQRLYQHTSGGGWLVLDDPADNRDHERGVRREPERLENRHGRVENVLEQKIAESPTVSARMRNATRVSEIFTAANYSYRAHQGHGAQY